MDTTSQLILQQIFTSVGEMKNNFQYFRSELTALKAENETLRAQLNHILKLLQNHNIDAQSTNSAPRAIRPRNAATDRSTGSDASKFAVTPSTPDTKSTFATKTVQDGPTDTSGPATATTNTSAPASK
jgi:hypothetical protein